MRPPLEPMRTGSPETPPSPVILTTLELLHRAREAARDVSLDPWEFAVGLPELFAAGLSGTDVRWLVAKGYVQHALERVRPGKSRRSFCRMANFALTARTCFVLTDAGAEVLARWTQAAAPGNIRSDGVTSDAPGDHLPRWDEALRQLWYLGKLVKWYRVPAESQETILAVFQEECWPARIDDPLGQVPGHDPRERLHEAVKGLNRSQVNPLLEFHRDGTGEGVTWAARERQ